MGYSTLQFGFQPYHPSQSHMLLLCAFYVDNVDPIFKVIHVPSLKKSVSDASHDLNNVLRNKSMEALFFAMYYAAITSLSTEQCETYFQENKSQLLAKYQVACKIAFANADILIGADLVLLQALVIFLVSKILVPATVQLHTRDFKNFVFLHSLMGDGEMYLRK